MDRRRFFRFLPLSALGVVGRLPAQTVSKEEPSPWVEWQCQSKAYDYRHEPPTVMFECHTKFKSLRGTVPICPMCGYAMAVGPDKKDKVVGIEIK
jgi:hypothetical protein